MGRLIIDGNQVYEIDEECLKKKKPPKDCQVYSDYKKNEEIKKNTKK